MYGDGLRMQYESLFYPESSMSALNKVFTYTTTNPAMALDSQGISDLDFRALGYLIWQASNATAGRVSALNLPIYRKCGTVYDLGIGTRCAASGASQPLLYM